MPLFQVPAVDLPSELNRLVRQIPRGMVTTYGDLARALGDDKTRSARWIGEYLKEHPHPADCPCHRVVRLTGEIGLHVSGDSRRKAALLKAEGVSVSKTGLVNLDNRFVDFEGHQPLAELRAFQRHLGARVVKQRLKKVPRTLAGVDVAYLADGTACGAYVLLDAKTLDVEFELTLDTPVTFPYIPGYLTYRELPVMLELCHQAECRQRAGDVIFCDGNGQLHPWRAGIAACLGVMLDHPVIGIGKSLLCGTVDRPETGGNRPLNVTEGGEVVAQAIRAHPAARPVYVSIGNRITLHEATKLAQRTLTRHRVPEPIYFADRLSKQLRRQLAASRAADQTD